MNNVIVSPHYLSTELGSSVFKKGGNAVDAAIATNLVQGIVCLLYTSPSPRDRQKSRMPSSA